MRQLPLPGGGSLPVLGQGTWGMGERGGDHAAEVAALRHGLDLGLGLVDTAEMYGSGGAEEVVAEAVRGCREEAFLVSKVFPHHASRRGAVEACERSLRRLGTDHLDCYLLHWRGSTPLDETLEGFEELRAAGKIRWFGVSNFDPGDLDDLRQHGSGRAAATNQVLYNLTRRGVELDLLPQCRERGLPVMAYSPVEQGRVLGDPVLRRVAERHGATPARVALAWVLRGEGVCAIPKAATCEHVQDNLAALDLHLSTEDIRSSTSGSRRRTGRCRSTSCELPALPSRGRQDRLRPVGGGNPARGRFPALSGKRVPADLERSARRSRSARRGHAAARRPVRVGAGPGSRAAVGSLAQSAAELADEPPLAWRGVPAAPGNPRTVVDLVRSLGPGARIPLVGCARGSPAP